MYDHGTIAIRKSQTLAVLKIQQFIYKDKFILSIFHKYTRLEHSHSHDSQ